MIEAMPVINNAAIRALEAEIIKPPPEQRWEIPVSRLKEFGIDGDGPEPTPKRSCEGGGTKTMHLYGRYDLGHVVYTSDYGTWVATGTFTQDDGTGLDAWVTTWTKIGCVRGGVEFGRGGWGDSYTARRGQRK